MTPFARSRRMVDVPGYGPVRLPYRCAAEWAEALDRGDRALLLNLVEPATQDQLLDFLATGEVTLSDLYAASLGALRDESRCETWWAAVRLLGMADKPSFHGRTVAARMDPWSLSLAEWCAGCLHLATENADDAGRAKFDGILHIPPPGYEEEAAEMTFEEMVSNARNMPGMA